MMRMRMRRMVGELRGRRLGGFLVNIVGELVTYL